MSDGMMESMGWKYSSVVDRWSRNWRLVGSIPGMSSEKIFFSRAGSYFSICSTPVLQQWHIKDPAHTMKKFRWRVHGCVVYTAYRTCAMTATVSRGTSHITNSAETTPLRLIFRNAL